MYQRGESAFQLNNQDVAVAVEKENLMDVVLSCQLNDIRLAIRHLRPAIPNGSDEFGASQLSVCTWIVH
jgi:hypothetical protein